ncbi:oxidoreductase [Thiohalobacter sp. COW1]|uniref:Dehydrogenase n=1 Tax=Thiohalobacter thiocyanaticus TaxID=585455 RepID=A0A1Z4VR66_9GAMM|nr:MULTISPECIES: SDR family NAD(P)-dependent oxidoreductase [Thiohalobacter]BAZ94126.1 dehydrogenase [Thiohalobacter thiocyanaticus]BCO30819.1 oxidoreductase [Thiohalobacter sp. COW1]
MANTCSTIWLLGASSGIGAELAPGLLARCERLVISARRRERLEAVRDTLSERGGDVRVLPVDVVEADAVAAAAQDIAHQVGVPDLVIYNVGDYEPAGMDQLDPAVFERITRINYLGAVNCLAAVVPMMRASGGGRILINASLSGYAGLPHAAAYGPTKAALINLAESLHPELARAGIHLGVINHGFVRTRLTEKNEFTMPQLLEPATAAAAILEHLDDPGFEIRFPRRLALMLGLLRMLPYRLFFALTRRLV